MTRINKFLKDLSINGDVLNRSICSVLACSGYSIYGEGKYHLQFIKHCQSWPHYSGNPSFPVPASLQDTSPKAAELAYWNAGNTTHDRWGGDYGLLRRNPALHLSQCDWSNPYMEN